MINLTDSLIHRIFEKAFKQSNLAVVDELLSSGHFAYNAFGEAPNDPKLLKWLIAMFRTASSGFQCTIEDEISPGNQFAVHWTLRGTHKGSFLGNLPTGRSVLMHGIIFTRVENGRMVEDWTLGDKLGNLQQLGYVLPTAGH